MCAEDYGLSHDSRSEFVEEMETPTQRKSKKREASKERNHKAVLELLHFEIFLNYISH